MVGRGRDEDAAQRSAERLCLGIEDDAAGGGRGAADGQREARAAAREGAADLDAAHVGVGVQVYAVQREGRPAGAQATEADGGEERAAVQEIVDPGAHRRRERLENRL